MGRYLSANFVTYLGEKRLRCFSKISSLRKTNQRNVRSKQRSLSSSLTTPFGDLRRRGTHDTLQSVLAVRLYSTSSRDVLKTEAPVGIYQEQKSSLQLSFLGVRLGDSFQRLSKHINLYFKQSDLSINQAATSSGLVCTLHEPQRRQQRRALSQRATKDRRVLEDSSIDQSSLQLIEAAEKQPEARTVSILYTGLQLFHPSSITTRFGESYNYVANHINSVFSRSPETDVYSNAAVFESQHQRARHGRRRKIIKVTPEARPPPVQDHILQASAAPQVDSKDEEAPSSWEEGYLHFSQHINRYFGAKVSDNGSSATVNPTPKSHTLSKNLSSPPGLFHTSNDATSFGANHMQMANHINQYFNGQQGFEDDLDGDYMDLTAMAVAPPEEKPTSFMQFLMNPTTAIPEIISSYLKVSPKSQEATVDSRAKPIPTEAQLRRVVLGQSQVEDMMKVLISNLRSANTPSSIISCTEDLNRHLMAHPTCKSTVWQEKVALQLLRHRRNHASDVKLQRAIRETMALIGFLGPVKGRGVRVLSIDGGGTRGVVPLEVLKQIEAQTGKRIHELFDYMCGVSTGAVLAFMVGLGRFSLDECEDMYRRFGSDVFKQNPLVGTMKMGWTHSYYSTETWENLLKEKMGERVLIKTARSDQCPKVSAVSAVVNWGMSPKAFIFRNYNHAPGKLSRYAGGSAYKLWEAVRASSAAPGYFKEFPLHSDIHQDGGLIQNNPCAIAVHESRLLWPSQPFQCVLSLGTGRYDNAQRGPATSTSLRAKLSHLIYSATDTEGVHTLLGDLLAENVYFRFNPMLSAEVALDECRPLALDQLKADTLGYLDRNQHKLEQVCKVLSTERTTLARSKDWVSERAWELKHSWM